MTRKLHTRTKIFFPDAYVIRVDHPEIGWTHASGYPSSFNVIRHRAYKLIGGTWGYTTPNFEFLSDQNVVSRSYWCFRDEEDALQFRLMIGNNTTRVYLWPEKFFTIHEIDT